MYYDNILAIGDHDVIEQLVSIWKKNFSEEVFNITVKEHTLLTASELSAGAAAEYLGVSIERMKRSIRGRDGAISTVFGTRWRQMPERLKKWQPFIEQISNTRTMSYRNFSKMCGRIIWAGSLKKHSQLDLHPLLRILRKHMREKHCFQRTWDSSMTISKEDAPVFESFIQGMYRNSYQYAEETEGSFEDVWACSDSCDNRRGYVVLGDEGQVIREWGKDWPPEVRLQHIYLKEFIAASETVKAITRDRPEQLHIRLGIDNAAVFHAISRGYSAIDTTAELLLEMRAILRAHRSLLSVYLLRSEDNAADPASRNRQVDEEAARSCRAVMARAQIQEAMEGLRTNTYNERKTPTACTGGALRHAEHECVEDEKVINFLCGELVN